MMRPCPACSRHVRETSCPFCGAAVPAAARGAFAGPFTRAAVFSALAGCWTGSAPADQTTTVEHKTDTRTQTQTQKPPPTTAAGTIEGTVTDSNSGGPIAYAQVTLVEGGHVTQTDDQGHYTFEGIAPGTYTIRVNAHGPNPRSGGAFAQASVVLGDTGARADVQVAVPVYHYNPHQTPMPYGAPPARKRVV